LNLIKLFSCVLLFYVTNNTEISAMVKKVYNLKYASRLLDIDRGTLYRWNKEGKIRLRFIDSIYFITYEDLSKLRDVQISKGFDIPEVGAELRFESSTIPNN